MTKKLILVTFFSFLFCTQFIFSQNSDIGPESVTGVGSNNGITPQERVFVQNQTHSKTEVPTEILDALNEARKNNDIVKMNELNNIILKNYSNGVRVVGTSEFQNQEELPIPDRGFSSINYKPDWLNNDVLADTGTTLNYQRRNLDLKHGDDGNMYIAHSLNQAGYRGIQIVRSTDEGATWSYIGGIYYPSINAYIMTLSMIVDKRGTTNDSTLIIVYYTHSAATDNNGAALGFFSFNPATGHYNIRSIDTPPAGREFNYVSAVSDGQYYGTATYIGCIVGDYSNDADSTYNINLYRSIDWGDSHTSVSLGFASSSWVDRYPNAAFLPGANFSDSIMIVTQRDFSGYNLIRGFVTSWSSLSSDFRTIFLNPSVFQGKYYEKPFIAIKQGVRTDPKDIIISCTKDSVGVYHTSIDGGVTWGLDYTLDQQFTKTTNWTAVSADSMSGTGDFMVVYSNFNYDSINVRRGTNGSLGGTTFKGTLYHSQEPTRLFAQFIEMLQICDIVPLHTGLSDLQIFITTERIYYL